MLHTIYGPIRTLNMTVDCFGIDSDALTWKGIAEEAVAAGLIDEPGTYFIQEDDDTTAAAFVTIETVTAPKLVVK